jgi:putative transposase
MAGWAFLATVTDGFSRKVVGWSVADHMREELVIDALSMALANRNPGIGEVVFHSDRAPSTLAVIFAAPACPTESCHWSAIPVSASTTPPPSRGMRRSRKSSSTCACGVTLGHVKQATFEYIEVYYKPEADIKRTRLSVASRIRGRN